MWPDECWRQAWEIVQRYDFIIQEGWERDVQYCKKKMPFLSFCLRIHRIVLNKLKVYHDIFGIVAMRKRDYLVNVANTLGLLQKENIQLVAAQVIVHHHECLHSQCNDL
jgi:hypothetical protein